MILFPHAKINLGLYVLRERTDGYRDIESVLVPIPIHDVLEVVLDDGIPGDVVFTRSGIEVPGSEGDDLVLQARAAFAQTSTLPGMRVHLHKNIPIGAGLGGGSSDAAHMLLLLNTLLQRNVPAAILHDMASGLGSDVPFFLQREAQFAQGRGEQLSALPLDPSAYWLVLVDPGIHVSTAEVYANTALHKKPVDIRAVLRGPIDRWPKDLKNDMEEYVFRKHPELPVIKEALYRAGAKYASMSGSGSSVFGLFSEVPVADPSWSSYRHWVVHLGRSEA